MSVHTGIATSEERLIKKAEEKRLERKRKEAIRNTLDAPSLSVFPCPTAGLFQGSAWPLHSFKKKPSILVLLGLNFSATP